MATYFRAANDIFWSPSFWLPEGFQWKDLEPQDSDIYYPRIQDINWCVLVGVLFLVVRYVYERFVVEPLGRWMGVKETKKRVTPNPVLESAYLRNRGRSSHDKIVALTKQTDLSEKEIQRWFYRRRFQDAATPMQKLCECSWHLLFYLTSFLGGLYVLWDKDWFWKSKYCFINWPYQNVGNDLYLYYLLELGFYWSLLFSSLYDVRRKDFWEMTIHHVITINLIYWSWVINFVRIGALVIIVHDMSDYWVALAKLAKYTNKQTLCELFFGVFIVVWTITRLGMYPYWVLYAAVIDIHNYVKPFKVHRMFVFLLCSLQFLHIIWTFMIYRVALQKFKYGSLQRDVRSDSEEEDEDDVADDDNVRQPVMNGAAKSPVTRENNNETPPEK